MATAKDVPTTDGMLQALRWLKNGISDEIDAKIALAGGGSKALEGVSVDGTLQPVQNKIAILGLSAYLKKTDVASGYHYKGSVNNFSDLPNSGMAEGDMYNILIAGGTDMNGDSIKAGDNVAWTGTGWDVLSGMVDLSQCVMKVPGKDLSTNDFTNADKAKLDSLQNSNYTLPTASSTTKGGVKVGNGLQMNGDTLNVTMVAAPSYVMPTASTTTKGGVKVGTGLRMNGETLSATATNYTLPTASTSIKGGFKVGSGLSMNGETLNAVATSNYTLPTASKSTKGGFKVGDGLSMNGETLNVTLQSGDKYDAFDGASTNFGGTSGLVPSPSAGDNKNFLRGDGTWAPATQNITVYSAAVTVPPSPQGYDGALWEDTLSNGDPVLKFRYGDYEFNFNYDTKNYTGTTPPPITPEDAQLYMLDTVPSTDEGTLWYNVTQSTYFPIPALCLHAGSFDYGYNYDTITYKGGNTGLVSYLPLQQGFGDAMSNGTLTSSKSTPSIESFKINGVTYRGLRNVNLGSTGSTTGTSNGYFFTLPTTLNTYTVDFWFSVLASNAINASIFIQLYGTYNAGYNYYSKEARINYTATNNTHPAPGRYHLAFVHAGIGSDVLVYCDGKFVATPNTNLKSYPLEGVRLFWNTPGTGAASYTYIDHLRVWNKVVWDGNFEVPKMSDY